MFESSGIPHLWLAGTGFAKTDNVLHFAAGNAPMRPVRWLLPHMHLYFFI